MPDNLVVDQRCHQQVHVAVAVQVHGQGENRASALLVAVSRRRQEERAVDGVIAEPGNGVVQERDGRDIEVAVAVEIGGDGGEGRRPPSMI